MAFGAQTRDILRLVVDQGMRPVAVGLAVGLAAAPSLGRLIGSQLYQTSAHSALLLTVTIVTLGLVAMLACIVPARWASASILWTPFARNDGTSHHSSNEAMHLSGFWGTGFRCGCSLRWGVRALRLTRLTAEDLSGRGAAVVRR